MSAHNVLKEKKEGLSKQAYHRIKNMILQKELMPGQFINEAQLQELLGIGRTPVREAILALSQDNLVVVHPRKGIEVARPSPKAIHDIFETRSLLEPTVLRQCFSMIDLQWAIDMRTTFLQHEDDIAGNSPQTAAPLISLDNQFHLDLIDTLRNQYISKLMRSLTDYLDLIRVTAWKISRYQVSNQEHIAILDAILAQDIEASCRSLSDHIQVSYQDTIDTMMHSLY